MRRALLGLALLASCAPADEEPAIEAEPRVAVVSELGFGREEPEGQSVGFDLDGRVSDEDDVDGCGVVDLTHAVTGEPGIDNAFAGLLPALELAGAGPLEDLVQASVTNSELLLLLEMDGLEEAGECVSLTLSRAIGPARVGGDGWLLPGQTFDVNPEAPISTIECAAFDGTRLVGTGLEYRLPLNVFDEYIDLTLLDGTVEVEMHEDGTMSGVIGGGLSIAEVAANVASLDGIGDQIPQLIGPLLDANADLDPTGFGSCQQLSVVLTFGAISAFTFGE